MKIVAGIICGVLALAILGSFIWGAFRHIPEFGELESVELPTKAIKIYETGSRGGIFKVKYQDKKDIYETVADLSPDEAAAVQDQILNNDQVEFHFLRDNKSTAGPLHRVHDVYQISAGGRESVSFSQSVEEMEGFRMGARVCLAAFFGIMIFVGITTLLKKNPKMKSVLDKRIG